VATVLVCDDQPVLRELVRAALADGDYEIFEATDAGESLRLAREVRPAVVILDLVLPGRSGLDVLADIRRDPALAETRVVLCSAGMRNVDSRVVDSLAADRYLPKPFSPAELAAMVEELIEVQS
jgi:DNA-binding response OmpR family regulator